MNDQLYKNLTFAESEDIIIRDLIESDVDGLFEICSNDNIYRFTSNHLQTRKKDVLKVAIRKFVNHDFMSESWILSGICVANSPDKIVGTMEMFDYDKTIKSIEIGYRINEKNWGEGIAKKAINAVIKYLFTETEIKRICAYVMPENDNSKKVLLQNNFTRDGIIRQGKYLKGKGIVDMELYALLKTDYLIEKRGGN